MSRWTALLVAAWLLVAAPTKAHAQYSGFDAPAAVVVTLIAGGLGAGVAVGSIVTLVGGARDLALGRASRPWRIANYVLGVLDILAGIPLVAVYVSTHAIFEPAMGIPLIAIGVTDLGLAIASSTRARGRAVTVAPVFGHDRVAGSYGGVSVVVRF